MPDYDPAANGIRGYWLSIAALRELRVRLGKSPPLPGDDREERWAREGVPYSWIKMERLDTVREGS